MKLKKIGVFDYGGEKKNGIIKNILYIINSNHNNE